MNGVCGALLVILVASISVRPEGVHAQRAAVLPRDAGIRLHAGAVVPLLEQLGGRRIHVVNAALVAVLNPQAFVIEPATRLRTAANRQRVLILVERGALAVNPELALDRTVEVFGTARTVLGAQVTREVPWPEELTRENIRRYEVGAVVLASSVKTSDGVELISGR